VCRQTSLPFCIPTLLTLLTQRCVATQNFFPDVIAGSGKTSKADRHRTALRWLVRYRAVRITISPDNHSW
jgi:hypothetical protein